MRFAARYASIGVFTVRHRRRVDGPVIGPRQADVSEPSSFTDLEILAILEVLLGLVGPDPKLRDRLTAVIRRRRATIADRLGRLDPESAAGRTAGVFPGAGRVS